MGGQHHGLVTITTAQLHSTKPEPTFCAGSNPEIADNGPNQK